MQFSGLDDKKILEGRSNECLSGKRGKCCSVRTVAYSLTFCETLPYSMNHGLLRLEPEFFEICRM